MWTGNHQNEAILRNCDMICGLFSQNGRTFSWGRRAANVAAWLTAFWFVIGAHLVHPLLHGHDCHHDTAFVSDNADGCLILARNSDESSAQVADGPECPVCTLLQFLRCSAPASSCFEMVSARNRALGTLSSDEPHHALYLSGHPRAPPALS